MKDWTEYVKAVAWLVEDAASAGAISDGDRLAFGALVFKAITCFQGAKSHPATIKPGVADLLMLSAGIQIAGEFASIGIGGDSPFLTGAIAVALGLSADDVGEMMDTSSSKH